MIPCKKKNNRTLRKCKYNPKQVVNFLIIYGNSMTVPWYMMLIDEVKMKQGPIETSQTYFHLHALTLSLTNTKFNWEKKKLFLIFSYLCMCCVWKMRDAGGRKRGFKIISIYNCFTVTELARCVFCKYIW